MRVSVKLFAGFQQGRFVTSEFDLPAGTTVQAVLDQLKIPSQEVGVMLVDSRHVGFERTLAPGEVLAIFPIIGGG